MSIGPDYPVGRHPLDLLLPALRRAGAADIGWRQYAEGVPAKGLASAGRRLLVKADHDAWSLYDRWDCDSGTSIEVVDPDRTVADPDAVAREILARHPLTGGAQ